MNYKSTSHFVFEDTLLIVTSSHGTELLEHGYVGSAWTLYEEVLRVPLVVHAPGFVAPGRVAHPVSLADVVPTLQSACGLGAGILALDGQALVERSRNGLTPRPARGEVIAELVVPELCILRACIRADWKLVEAVAWVAPEERLALTGRYDEIIAQMQDGTIPRPDPWGAPVRRELFDLAQDPRETEDAALRFPDQLALLTVRLGRYAEFCLRNGLAAKEAARRAELPEAVDQLQQLGYL